MKVIIFLTAALLGTAALAAEDGWQLGAQAWTFRGRTFFETVDTLKAMGVRYIEAYPGQKLGGGLEGTTQFTMDEATRAKVKAKLDQAGIKLVNYGVVNGKNEDEWRQIFAFAKSMGIETVNCEPPQEQLDTVEKLAGEFGVNVGIHNHPAPSRYWNPDTVLEAVKGRGPRMGACVDTGHWVRSGLDPVECLKKLEGRIRSVHFKDLNVRERGAHDVPWGTGASDAAAQLRELKRQGYQGTFSIEYEHNTPELDANVAKCVEYFNAWKAD